MDKFEKNIVNSFRLAKSDIVKMQQEIIELAQIQEKLLKVVAEIKVKNSTLEQKIKTLQSKVSRKKKK